MKLIKIYEEIIEEAADRERESVLGERERSVMISRGLGGGVIYVSYMYLHVYNICKYIYI